MDTHPFSSRKHGGDLWAAVKDFFASRDLLKQVNHSIIALVPKLSNANLVANFQPISCCNVIYKVISKILAGRMTHVLQDIISPAQNAFLRWRNMADNIRLMQELLQHYGRKRASPDVLIRLISERLLTLFNGLFYDKYFCYWVSLLVLSVSLCNVLRLLPFLLLLMGIYMVSLRGNTEFVKEILFPSIFLLLVWNTFPGCLNRVHDTLISISTPNVLL